MIPAYRYFLIRIFNEPNCSARPDLLDSAII